MTLQATADWLMQYAVYIWLTLTVPALFICLVAFSEGHRLVQEVREQNGSPAEQDSARLLRALGGTKAIVLLAFAVLGIVSLISLVDSPQPAITVQLPTAVNIRRIIAVTLFLISPPLLGYAGWRILRFASPRFRRRTRGER